MTERIENEFVRSHFGWDRMSEVKWDLVRQGVVSAERVLLNADKFPNADFDYLERQHLELMCFMVAAPLSAW